MPVDDNGKIELVGILCHRHICSNYIRIASERYIHVKKIRCQEAHAPQICPNMYISDDSGAPEHAVSVVVTATEQAFATWFWTNCKCRAALALDA